MDGIGMTWSFDGTDVTVEIAPDDGLWAESPTWVDITGSVRSLACQSSARTSEIEQSQPGTLEVVLDNRDRTFDLAYGPANVAIPGTNGNYWSTPDDAAFAGATGLDVRVAVALADWSPSTVDTLMAQYGAAGQRVWRVAINTSGYLQLITSANGTATSTRDSGVRVSAVDGQVMACRVVWENSGGTTTYYIKRTKPSRAVADCQSDDGWTVLGAVDTGVTHTLFNGTATIAVGAMSDGTAASAGTFYYAQVATSTNGTPDLVWWPKDAASAAATSWVSSMSGETWTQQGTTTLSIQGTYYRRLNPGTPIRVVATRSSTDYPLWYGYVRRSPQDWPSMGMDATVQLTATDSLGWLQDMQAPPYVLGMFRAQGTNPVVHYWPMHEPTATTQVANLYGSANANWSGLRDAGGPTVPAQPGLTTSLLSGGKYVLAESSAGWSFFTDGNPLLSFQVYVPDESSTFRVMCGDGTNTIGIYYGIGGEYQVIFQGGALGAVEYAWRLTPGAHTVNIYAGGGSALVYVDGARMELGGAVTGYTTDRALLVGGVGCTVSDVRLLQEGADVEFDAEGNPNDTSGERMTRLLSIAGAPAALTDITADTSTFLGPVGAGGTYGELCRQTAVAEWGRFYVAADGKITLRSRLWDWTATEATTSQATVGDSGAEVPYNGIVLDPGDKAQIANEVIVSLPNGTSGTASNAESIAAHGRRTLSLAAPLASPEAADGLAAYIVSLRAWPEARITSLSLNPRAATSVWAQVLERAIGDRITVKRRPTATTDPITATLTVERISHSINRNGTWTTTLLTAPAVPTSAEAGYLTLDDAVLGNLDAGLSLAP